MEEIDIRELLNYFKKKMGLFITIFALACLIGCGYSFFFQKPMYSSYTKVILSGENTITQNDVVLNKNLVDTYAEVVKSRRVLSQVIKKLDLDLTYEELMNEISVTSVSNTEIIQINVSDKEPEMAANIANATASYFTKEVLDLYKMNNVNILDEAIVNETPYNINVPKQLLIYIILGIIASSGIIFVLYYFDRTIKSVDQVEQKINLPILGSIQEFSKKGRRRWKTN